MNLNSGAGGNNIYLWYKIGDKTNAVTRVQVSFNEKMEIGLQRDGFTKIKRNLNAGTDGGHIFMWISRTTRPEYDVPIVDVKVTTSAMEEAKLLTTEKDLEKVTCDLNLGAGGDYVYAWLKREQPIYIRNVTATSDYSTDYQLLSTGYTRVDVNTNMGTTGAESFIWYRKTTDFNKSLSALTISTSAQQEEDTEDDGFEKVKVNLNENTGGVPVYLWYKEKAGAKSIHAMVLLTNKNAVDIYQSSGINVIKRNLNEQNPGDIIFLCYV